MTRSAPAIALACLALLAPSAAAAPFRADPDDPGSPTKARAALTKVERLKDGRGVKSGFELTPALRDLAVRFRALSGADRRRAAEVLERPTINEGQPGEDEYLVPEHAPFCSAHFCIHWVDATEDAPPPADANANGVPDYVETVSNEAENSFQVENGQLGWRPAVSDGTRGGGNGMVDIYLKQLGNSGIFGYTAPDPGQRSNQQAAYLVVDNDYTQAEYPRTPNPLIPIQVTTAHEYNHALQFGYDVLQDVWMLESTAVWMEDRVYDSANDWYQFLPAFAQLSEIPLTRFNSRDGSDPLNYKAYGSAVWNHWIDEHLGPETIRGAWERSLQTSPASFAPGAYDASLRAAGAGGFTQTFTAFAAALAEWRAANSGISEGPGFPGDMQRSTTSTLLPNRGAVSGHLDHTASAYVNVAPTTDARIRFVGRLPRGTAGGIALVGLDGFPVGGLSNVVLQRIPSGGVKTVTLDNPSQYERITAVLVNADTKQDGFSDQLGDWVFSQDGQAVSGHVSTDFKAPKLRKRAPRPKARAIRRRPTIEIVFSEKMDGVSSRTVKLLAPNGRSVKARVSYSSSKRKAILKPRTALRARTRYTVRLSTDIVDPGGNVLPSTLRGWSFSTGRR